ncbi:MAG TPA: hypothetical protein ENG33_06425 [Chloroflexi bacterium]|nr:hypothetical protein [Chloroflexota bacterium]
MYPRMAVSDFLGDMVVYRNLIPMEPGLPRPVSEGERVPRKAEPAYASAVVKLLQEAQRRRTSKPIKALIYIGDTRMNDGTAIRNLRQFLPVLGFIGSENLSEPPRLEEEDGIFYANRWELVAEFHRKMPEKGFAPGEELAALIDLDKCAFGGRGRNDRAIDAARVEGVKRTVEEVLGGDFDEQAFRAVYDELNTPPYHPFTADNQDYLAYICLMVVGGVYPWEELMASLRVGARRHRAPTFDQFIEACHRRLEERGSSVPEGLLAVHREVYANFRRGDPTPFKSFRYREYIATVERMDALPDDTPLEKLLAEEIVLTGEVVDFTLTLKEAGVLLLGISDKPDEASIPQPEQEAKGYKPVHRVRMKMVRL